ncbi:MAG: Uma2 family endonuclease [Acidobacteria bacterium]|nr:Uma2 family endonuclease [Acidobacteriota bacterium]
MGLAQKVVRYTEEEYLAMERESLERHEYIDGEIYAMAGESLAHGFITINLGAEFRAQLKGSDCASLSPNMKVRSGPDPKFARTTKGFFSYADLMVFCGKPLFHDEFRDVLLNPKVIVEVLSPSTEAYDRGEKFRRYRQWIPTFTDYLLVSQTEPLVEHFRLDKSGFWVLAATVTDLADSIKIASIGCELKMAEIYDRVEFPALIEEEEEEKPKRKRQTKKAKK